ncbi:unnamed protein product [Laminaria digitata]
MPGTAVVEGHTRWDISSLLSIVLVRELCSRRTPISGGYGLSCLLFEPYTELFVVRAVHRPVVIRWLWLADGLYSRWLLTDNNRWLCIVFCLLSVYSPGICLESHHWKRFL